jgi:hypothetical protein
VVNVEENLEYIAALFRKPGGEVHQLPSRMCQAIRENHFKLFRNMRNKVGVRQKALSSDAAQV